MFLAHPLDLLAIAHQHARDLRREAAGLRVFAARWEPVTSRPRCAAREPPRPRPLRGPDGLTMKAIVHHRYGPDGVELREVDLPTIEDHQVLLKVHASSVNPAEWYRIQGPFFARFDSGLRRPKNLSIGGDVAGRVEAVGSDVTDFQPGDDVFGTAGGAWADYTPAREVRLVRKPASVSYEEAAAVPVAALTALRALRDHGNIPAGQKVLINGASEASARTPSAREVVRRRGHRQVQREERRPGRNARRRPRGRLHAAGLHTRRRASRRHARHRGQPAGPRIPARLEAGGDRRGRRSADVRARARSPEAPHRLSRDVAGSKPARGQLRREDHERGAWRS